VIDAGVNDNAARFINHTCGPNCESVTQNRRVFIEAIRTIEPGEELAYDYQIEWDPQDPPDIDEIFACRCGSAECRGTMLWPGPADRVKKKPARRAKKRAVRKEARRSGTRSGKPVTNKSPPRRATRR